MNQDNQNEQATINKIKLQFRIAATLVLIVLGLGTFFYHVVENLSWVDAFYFSVVSLATVGYGDIVPATTLGKLFTCFYILMGIGILATFANLSLKRAYIARKRPEK